jgi:hypothetical protein
MSGEIEQYVARAEMNPVMRSWGGLVLSSQGKAMKARVAEKFGDAVLAALDLEIARSVAERGMQNTSDLIDQAIGLSGGNELKFRELLTIALGYRQTVTKIQRRITDPFAL